MYQNAGDKCVRHGDHDRFVKTASVITKIFLLDGCRRDSDGYYWITGRVDDVLNVSGHRIGLQKLRVLVAHPKVSKPMVGFPQYQGQGIYCYVTLMSGELRRTSLRTKELGSN